MGPNMPIPERSINVRHVHIEQIFDRSVGKHGIRAILFFENITDTPLQFNIERVDVNGKQETRFDTTGATLAGQTQIALSTPHHTPENWRNGEPITITFAFELVY